MLMCSKHVIEGAAIGLRRNDAVLRRESRGGTFLELFTYR